MSVQLLHGNLSVIEADEYKAPASFNPAEWNRAGLLKSFGLYANQGYPFWKGRSFLCGSVRVTFEVLKRRLL
jgi:hypothetical protein